MRGHLLIIAIVSIFESQMATALNGGVNGYCGLMDGW